MAARRFIQPLFLLAPALALVLGLGAAKAQTIPPALSVTPNPAPAGKAFTLTLNGVATRCGAVYTHQSVSVNEGRIDLQYTVDQMIFIDDPIVAKGDVEPIDPVCPVFVGQETVPTSILPNAPMFAMPALKAGSYEVWATNVPACAYAKPACAVKLMPVAAGKLAVTEQGAITYLINPTAVEAGLDFELSLLSYDFNCGHTFDNLSVAVGEGVITLSFLDHPNPAAICPAIYKPYGPTFKVSGLKAGTYKVKAYRHPACLPCKMLGETADAGVLTVKTTIAKKGWYLKNDNVVAAKPFDMQLLKDDVGNCQTSFSHQSVSTSAGGIYASFLLETHPERVCIQDMRPFGPTFSMQALKVGTYPVYPIQLAQCEVTPPFCAIDRIAPVATDTLLVTQTLAINISELRAKSPAVSMRGNKATFTLPAGRVGTWQAELVTLDGRVLGAKTVTGGAGMQVEIPVGRAPANAVSLLRLTSPEGGQTFMPIVR